MADDEEEEEPLSARGGRRTGVRSWRGVSLLVVGAQIGFVGKGGSVAWCSDDDDCVEKLLSSLRSLRRGGGVSGAPSLLLPPEAERRRAAGARMALGGGEGREWCLMRLRIGGGRCAALLRRRLSHRRSPVMASRPMMELVMMAALMDTFSPWSSPPFLWRTPWATEVSAAGCVSALLAAGEGPGGMANAAGLLCDGGGGGRGGGDGGGEVGCASEAQADSEGSEALPKGWISVELTPWGPGSGRGQASLSPGL